MAIYRLILFIYRLREHQTCWASSSSSCKHGSWVCNIRHVCIAMLGNLFFRVLNLSLFFLDITFVDDASPTTRSSTRLHASRMMKPDETRRSAQLYVDNASAYRFVMIL